MFDRDLINSGGPYRDNGADLVVGYNAGYCASWDSAVGRVSDSVFADNTKAWSGDHCIDPRLVAGRVVQQLAYRCGGPRHHGSRANAARSFRRRTDQVAT